MSNLPKKSISQDRMSRMKRELLDMGADLTVGAIPGVNWPEVAERFLNKYFETREIDFDDSSPPQEGDHL